MPRPVRKRTIYQKPKYCRFRPDHETEEEVNLTLDELEAVRLSDLIHLDQSEGAERMNIARTTFQKILNSAHEKIADALVNGKTLGVVPAGKYDEEEIMKFITGAALLQEEGK